MSRRRAKGCGSNTPPNREWGQKGDLSRKEGRAQMVENTSGDSLEKRMQLNLNEVEKVRSLLSKLEKPKGTCSLTHSGMFLFPFPFGKSPFSFGLDASDISFKQYWILDSGATDHITPLATHFATYSPCPSNKKIFSADGSLIPTGKRFSYTNREKDILPSKRITNVIIDHLINSFSGDITFHEQEKYFIESHFQGENVNEEDETLLLPDLILEPEIEVETSSDNIGMELDSGKMKMLKLMEDIGRI
ncbi:hypothetical protein KIW84_073565 [Lathyrus oleraceus]|uniref:Retrovirus-related Pol polyprotein from transposon TNT 1-94-like beta-barrel domain-containing protein n=1 Tax=Pisum sativum TaxID=3888 RepID=A0A9D4VRM5_PEA|nr:hypothetical protein KIW84_073565 [Pisum sativum]